MMIALFLIVSMVPDRTSEIAVAPMPRAKVCHLCTYVGKVRAVDKLSITIQGSEQGGQFDEEITRRFVANDCLVEGRQDPRYFSCGDYRLSDVKVGDRVFVFLHPSGDDDLCASVRIKRRPGGKVPPAPFDDPRGGRPYHVTANLLQAYEEKGVPLPRDLDPVLSRIPTQAELDFVAYVKKRRAEVTWQMYHIAPMPRAVKRSR